MTRKLAALVLLLALVFGIRVAHRAGAGRDPAKRTRTDIFAFMEGARALGEGRSPFGVREPEHGYAYVYPPAIAVVFVPIRALGRTGGPIAWYAISVAVLTAGVLALRRALGPSKRDLVEVGVPLALVALPTTSALDRGQFGPVLAGLLALGAAGLARGRDAGGAAVGSAVALKATPVLALAALRPRSLGWAAAAILVLDLALPACFLGPRGAVEANLAFARSMGVRYVQDPESDRIGAERDYDVYRIPTNQSLVALAHRAGLGGTRAFAPVAALIALATVVVAALPALRLKREAPPVAVVAAVGLGGAATLLASPVAWHNHHVVLLPVLVAVAAEAARASGPRRNTWLALGAFGVLELLHFGFESLRPAGLFGLGTLIPLGLAARLAWREGAPYNRPP